jgi:hypothetical protein
MLKTTWFLIHSRRLYTLINRFQKGEKRMTFTPGFNSTEAESLIALLANLEGAPPPPLVAPPIPPNWTLIYDSPVIGVFDNKWQLYQYTENQVTQYAILIRGTVDSAGSIIDDLLAVMIPASGSITVDSITLSYQLAADPLAGVHLGFALAALILLYDPVSGILVQLLKNNVPIDSDVFVAGHSQGAAIATIIRSYLNYSLFQKAASYNYKTYLFSQPKPGNDHYGNDYEFVASQSGLGFTLANTQDWVWQVPFTFELPGDLNTPNPLSVLSLSHLSLDLVEGILHRLKEHVAIAQIAKHTPQAQTLADALKGQNLPETAPATVSWNIPILHTFNFMNCGAPIILQGVPGSNPCKSDDFFWQHHAAMYYDLLAGISIPTDCPPGDN